MILAIAQGNSSKNRSAGFGVNICSKTYRNVYTYIGCPSEIYSFGVCQKISPTLVKITIFNFFFLFYRVPIHFYVKLKKYFIILFDFFFLI